MHASRSVLLLIVLALLLIPAQHSGASGAPPMQDGVLGGVNILSSAPSLVCVGDTISFEGAANIDYPDVEYVPGELPPPVPLPIINLKIEAQNGQVSPNEIYHPGNDMDFKFFYKATTPGVDMITVSINNGLASTNYRVEVEEKCDYDVYLTELIHFRADTEDGELRTVTTVNGTGILNRDREGYYAYQGDGKWHLEEHVLTKPSFCVEYYAPPIIVHGPFDLEGMIDVYHEMLDVTLQFKPNTEPFFHGMVICIDADGERGEGWGIISNNGDASKAAKIETSFPMGGGTNRVEMAGAGMDIVESVGDLDYTAILTLIPR